jgi:hypothetical protein
VVYLTHRPDYFGPRSKAWLRKHEFPTGPLLLSDIGEFFGGSGAFKTEQIRNLRERFEKVELGVGDKVSDAQSYHENGLRTYLILDVPPAPTAEQLRALAEGLNALSQDVQVVRTWAQIERGVFEGAVFDRQAAQRMLIERAESLEAEAAASAPSGETDKADD